MSGIVLYKTTYGSTKQYAEWAGEELALPVKGIDAVRAAELRDYDLIVLGSSVRMGKLTAAGWLRKNLAQLSGKRLFLFTVSGAAPGSPEMAQAMQVSLPGELAGRISHFPLGGRLRIADLSAPMRFFFNMAAKSAQKQGTGKTMFLEFDRVKREELLPLLDAVRDAVGPRA